MPRGLLRVCRSWGRKPWGPQASEGWRAKPSRQRQRLAGQAGVEPLTQQGKGDPLCHSAPARQAGRGCREGSPAQGLLTGCRLWGNMALAAALLLCSSILHSVPNFRSRAPSSPSGQTPPLSGPAAASSSRRLLCCCRAGGSASNAPPPLSEKSPAGVGSVGASAPAGPQATRLRWAGVVQGGG